VIQSIPGGDECHALASLWLSYVGARHSGYLQGTAIVLLCTGLRPTSSTQNAHERPRTCLANRWSHQDCPLTTHSQLGLAREGRLEMQTAKRSSPRQLLSSTKSMSRPASLSRRSRWTNRARLECV